MSCGFFYDNIVEYFLSKSDVKKLAAAEAYYREVGDQKVPIGK